MGCPSQYSGDALGLLESVRDLIANSGQKCGSSANDRLKPIGLSLEFNQVHFKI